MIDEETYEEYRQRNLGIYKEIKRRKKERRKESLRFKSKKLGWMFYILLILAGVCFIWSFIPMRFLIDEYSQKNLDRIIYHNPKLYINQYMLSLPFFLSIFFAIIGSFVKEIDNDLKSKNDNFREKSENIMGEKNWNLDRKSTRLNSSHVRISYAVFCLKKKKINMNLSDLSYFYTCLHIIHLTHFIDFLQHPSPYRLNSNQQHTLDRINLISVTCHDPQS